jgi:hypothetical protein
MLVLVTVLSLLGRWQWDVSQSARGGLQNFLYAFQWWFIAMMVIYGWWRLLHDEAVKKHASPPAEPAASAGLTGRGDDSWHTRRSTAELIEAQLAEADDGDDDGLAEYNEYLARLNARAQRMA